MAFRDVPLDCSFQSYNSLCASMQVILSSLAKGVQHNNPRTRWGAQYNNPQTRWNTLFSSLMAPKRLGEGANQDNVNNRARSDSSGLSSTGRWDVEQRVWCEDSFWTELRAETMKLILQHLPDSLCLDRACFEMAVKGEQGCDIVKDETLKQKIRSLWISLLQKHGSRQEDFGAQSGWATIFS